MNKTIIIVGIIVLIVVLVFRFGFKQSIPDISNKKRPDSSQKPAKLIDNDKIVLVKNLKLDYLTKAIEQFCNIYNQETFIALPRLFLLENEYVILFPYDIDFERFCYFINYLEYAHELCLLSDYRPDVKAWCSTKNGDAWITGQTVNKNVMIYIPDWDKEHDNVYLTTQDNLGFKIGFALGEASPILDKTVLKYESTPVNLNSLKNMKTIEFE